jgi:ABC-2 type transport system ATP-binding protein
MPSTQPIIQVEHLYKTYGSTRAVDDVSFEVRTGEIFVLIGPNGAGKTTTVEILGGLHRADSGSVRVLGLDPIAQGAQLRQRVGIQLQQAALPDKIKVWEAIDLYASFYPHPIDWRPLLEAWGLAEKRNASFISLSGGQRQRLFIALALVNDPELVFLDELTTGLDPQARHATWDLIRDIRRQGKAVVLVTHFMDEAEKLADRVGVIDHGKLVALDTPRSLIQGLNAEARVTFSSSNGFNLDDLRSIPGVTRVARDGDQVTVFGQNLPGKPSLLLEVAEALNQQGYTPTDLANQQPNLEDVFLTLTGHKMRE